MKNPATDCLIRNLKAWKDAAQSETVNFGTLALGDCPEDSTIGNLIDQAFLELGPPSPTPYAKEVWDRAATLKEDNRRLDAKRRACR